jgi:hypothetical protein
LAGILHGKLLLHSSETVHEPATPLAGWRRGPAPDPRFGPAVEPLRGDLRRVLDLGMLGEALAGEGFVPEQAPPRFLEIVPAGAFGDELNRPEFGGDSDHWDAARRGEVA